MPWFFPSFLSPTFLVLGILAISLPILFHFFRRTPRGNVRFSTLMFLQPSPPRLTRRSRVDNWLLLLLRALILLFIALAFGRIFIRHNDLLNISDLPNRRVAILVDTSASMLREGLWDQARQRYDEVLAELGPQDDLGVFVFDDELRTLVGFSSDPGQAGEFQAKRQMLTDALDGIQPGYRQTGLGEALIEVLAELKSDQVTDPEDQISESQIVLITDLQDGSDIQPLRSFEWPTDIPLEIKSVGEPQSDNAYLSLLDPSSGMAADSRIRVKVSNVEGSALSQFELKWVPRRNQSSELAATIVVPPGQSRVINLEAPDFEFDGLELTGDGAEFDNRYYLAYPQTIPEKIMLVGEDEEVRNQLRFYLEKACAPLIGRRFEFLDETALNDLPPDAPGRPAVVFVTGMIPDEQIERIRTFQQQGGLVCIVITSVDMEPVVAALLDETITLTEPEELDYALLVEIDFDNKVFAPFADPKYSNFSNIQFWNYRRLQSENLKPLAKFDTGDLAIGYRPQSGRPLYVWTSGWHPADSQFALSTKFVGVMMGMMLEKLTRENRNLELGDPIDLSELTAEDEATLVKPDGNSIELDNLSDTKFLGEADMPGIYQLVTGEESQRFALNLPAAESRTSRMSTELLEQEGIQLGTMTTATEKVEKERQRRDQELESRQKLWRWMLLLALLSLVAETLLAAFFARRQWQTDANPEGS